MFHTDRLMAQMTPDDRILDGNGATMGFFDATTRIATVDGLEISLDTVVRLHRGHIFELALPIGTWSVNVTDHGDIRINDSDWGRVDMFHRTPENWRRLQALLATVTVMPISHSGTM